ncbi:Creatininase [Thermobacillus xylanilyticus]|uniref:Creatininase n=1 Tax=Thermobacillus xylanilyticus TaxID=76633 RepID=A0ABM8V2B4_THEXY|nr:creatininase family protein [Thermobacillus xylanilyticus]CAG5082785.1 Creatininase [Thermobacillus xylanilyticus]
MRRYEGRTWNERFLPRLSTAEIAALDRERSLLVLPIASVEQHGGHLPVFTDSLLNEGLIEGAVAKLPPDAAVWVLPPLYYGKSTEHCGFSGTFSLSTETLLAVLRDLLAGAGGDGWRKLLIVNSHGGNPEVLALAARDARAAYGLKVFVVSTGDLYTHEAFPERELHYGIHGGALETSIMLSLKPEWVRQDQYRAEYPVEVERSHFKLGGAVTFGWLTSDVSETGVIGDPTLASADLGREIYGRVCSRLADMMLELLE